MTWKSNNACNSLTPGSLLFTPGCSIFVLYSFMDSGTTAQELGEVLGIVPQKWWVPLALWEKQMIYTKRHCSMPRFKMGNKVDWTFYMKATKTIVHRCLNRATFILVGSRGVYGKQICLKQVSCIHIVESYIYHWFLLIQDTQANHFFLSLSINQLDYLL